uniref:Ribose-5-phosphate isomerase A n=1 Tax=Candidatus Methanomethylicus mesodigestus TaxID=1867258 RepID=A0A7C3ER19_9CREN
MAQIGKLNAAKASLAEVKNGQVIGVGTGSTVAIFIELLGKKVKEEGWDVLCVPTSYQSAYLAIENGLRLTTLDEHPVLDLAVDGADEVDADLNLIKGGGAALTREKIVDASAKRFVVVADKTKLVAALGEKFPIPIEVIPLARKTASMRIAMLGGDPKLRDGGDRKDGPLVTDNGNFIIDAKFSPVKDPRALEFELKRIPGVVEAGLFVHLAHTAYIGDDGGVQRIDRRQE